MINLNSLEYPHYYYAVEEKDIYENFKLLKKTNLKIIKNDKALITWKVDYMENVNIYKITDFFSEEVRVKCNFKDHISPYNFYRNSKYYHQNKTVKYEEIDDFIYNNSKLCSNFPVTVAQEVYRYFKAKKVLDFSAGWGDRLIAALAYGCEYTGVDPNKDMINKYAAMIDFFSADFEKYNVYTQGFEDFIVVEKYDLVFTSPPFFDLEVYSDDQTQSIKKFPSLEEWKKNFMFMSVKKSKQSLIKGGHLALYISDFNKTKYVKDIINYAKNIGLIYKGYLSWKAEKYAKKIFVWQKV